MDTRPTAGGKVVRRAVLPLLRWAVSGIFLYAGVQKLAAPQVFADSIATFAILPGGLINPVALALPPFELLLALALATGIRRRAALLGLAVLMGTFMVALGSAMARGLAVDCGCFGSGEPSVSATWRAFLRDIPILAATLWLWQQECWRRDGRE